MYLVNEQLSAALQEPGSSNSNNPFSYKPTLTPVDPKRHGGILEKWFKPRQRLWMKFNETFGLYLSFTESSVIRRDVGIHLVSPEDGSIVQMNTQCIYEGYITNSNGGGPGPKEHQSFFVMNSCNGNLVNQFNRMWGIF